MYFFTNYGTHYQTSTTYGSAYYYNAAWADEYKAGDKQGNAFDGDITAAVQEFEMDQTDSTSSSTDYLKKASWGQSVIIGSSPVGLSPQQWEQATADQASMPVKYELKPIYDLFTGGWLLKWTNMQQSQLDTVYSNL